MCMKAKTVDKILRINSYFVVRKKIKKMDIININATKMTRRLKYEIVSG